MKLKRIVQTDVSGAGIWTYLDQSTIEPLANEIRGNEARGAVDLRNLVSEHVSIVIVGSHAKATLTPPHNLHGCSIGDDVLQVALDKSQSLELGPVRFVEGLRVRAFQRVHRK